VNKFADFLLLLLTQFAGGPGPRENNLMRFGLPAALWGALLLVAWSRQRQNELPREKMLVWGFGLGFARELFMFSHVALNLLGMASSTKYFAPEPLEHALTMAAIVVVAGAFLRYILNNVPLSRRYLRIGVGVTSICYVVTAWWWAGHTITAPECRFNQTWCGFLFHVATSVFMIGAIVLLSKKRGWLRNTVSLALTLFLLSDGLKLLNFPTGRAYAYILCPVSNSLHIWAIPLLGYVYIREQSIEKREAEEALEVHREHLEELVMERTAELGAQNAIAATTSQSLELDTILNTALDRVLAVLKMEAGCIFLLEPDGETLTLQVYRGGVSPGEMVEYVRQQCLCENISGQAVTGVKPVILDVSDCPTERWSSFIIEENLQVLVSTPLVSKGRALGALTLGARRPSAIPQQRLELLTAIGQQIGMAVENARLYQETEHWAEELALLHEVSVFLTSTLDPVTIYDQMTEQSAKLLGCPVTSIFRWDEERREAVGVSSYGVDDLGGAGLQMLLGESDILSDLIAHRQPIVIEDAQTDPRVSLLWREKFNIRALLCLAVWGKEKPLGFLCMIEPREPRHWRSNEVKLVESFVNRAAIALVNAHLHKQLEWAAALEERQRIAAEMHDGLAQTLSYMGHRIDHAAELAEAERLQEVLDECHHIRDTIDQASRAVRQSIASLQESPLPRRPLQDWLTEIAGEFTESGGPVATLVTRLTAPLFLPPSHVEQVLRVVQEALSNAGRHAQAQQIIISLERQGDQVTVMVEDDGRGFDVNSPPMDGRDHFGLSIMRARAARIGGQLEIDSSPGQGTRAILTWSLELSSSNNTFQ